MLKPMSFEQLSYLAQMVASVGVIVSLIFVGLQIRQNTGALQRNEHNSTMAQWTVIRMAIAKHRDIAELMTAGLHGEGALDAADQLRLEQMLQEMPGRPSTFGRERSAVFSRRDFRIDGRTSLERPAQNGARRSLVAHRQTYRLHSGFRRRCRRGAGQGQGSVRHGGMTSVASHNRGTGRVRAACIVSGLRCVFQCRNG